MTRTLAALALAAPLTLIGGVAQADPPRSSQRYGLHCSSDRPWLPDWAEEYVAARATVDGNGKVISKRADYHGDGPRQRVSATVESHKLTTGEVVVTLTGRMHRPLKSDPVCRQTRTLHWRR